MIQKLEYLLNFVQLSYQESSLYYLQKLVKLQIVFYVLFHRIMTALIHHLII